MKSEITSALRLIVVAAIVVFAMSPATATAKIKVVASVPDLASIASSVGGDYVDCSFICRPNADVHHVEVLPSYMVRVSRADVYLKVGMQLDQWADFEDQCRVLNVLGSGAVMDELRCFRGHHILPGI